MIDRAASRQAIADAITADHARATRRNRITVGIVVIMAVLACVVALVWLQFRPGEDSDAGAEIAAPNHAESFGFTLTPEHLGSDATPSTTVAVYEDFLCDSCGVFHEESSQMLRDEVAAGNISLTYYPFTFLLTQSTDEYSQRAANAAACVADAAGVLAYAEMHDLLMMQQPAMNGPGLSDAKLVDLGRTAGEVDVTECVEDRRFDEWVEAATQAGIAADVSETPTVRVNGMNVVRSDNGVESMPGPAEITFAIEATR